MCFDIQKKYFRMSFRFNKNKPEDFGLVKSQLQNDVYIDNSDNSKWIRASLYDFGWGNENGFIRLKKLNFMQLWELLVNSNDQENRYGAAHLLEYEHADDLMNHLLNILNTNNLQLTNSMKEAFKILKLNEVKNRSEVIGKSFSQIEKEFENWKYISQKVNEALI